MKQPQQTHGTPETRRSFDDEFKRQAVALMETGRPVRHLARELEVKASMLYEWKRKFGSSVSSSTPAPTDLGSLQEENRSLKAEVARLRQREDILKKTLGILSEPGSSASNASKR
jgi:transposase-like protein